MMDGSSCMEAVWERRVTRDGCPFYFNKETLASQWEHPYFSLVLQEAEDYSDVIYAAYRTALKLLHFRNNLYLQTLDVEKISAAFNDVLTLRNVRHHEYLTLTQLDEGVLKLYHCCDTPLSQHTWCAAVTSCLLYFFDGKKRGTVNTISALILLTVLCSDKLSSKYSFLFQCLSEDELIGPQDVRHMKTCILTILVRLGEDKAYRNGFEGNGTCMTRDMFLQWLFTEPRFIVWLSTVHRIHSAVSAVHQAKCYICKEQPIVGLRYRCLQCFNVDLCFKCFTRIPTYGKHDTSHAIEEYCVPSSKVQDAKAFIRKLKNNLKRLKHSKHQSNYEMEVTGRRQPATLCQDPKLLKSCSLADEDNINSPLAPVIESRPLSDESESSGQFNTFSRGYTAYKTKHDGCVYTDRYCPSLPRPSLPPSESHYTDTSIHCVDKKPFSTYYKDDYVSEQRGQTPAYTPHPLSSTSAYSLSNPAAGLPAAAKYFDADSSRPSRYETNASLDFYSTGSWSAAYRTSHPPTCQYETGYQQSHNQNSYTPLSEHKSVALRRGSTCSRSHHGEEYGDRTDRTLDSSYKPLVSYNISADPSSIYQCLNQYSSYQPNTCRTSSLVPYNNDMNGRCTETQHRLITSYAPNPYWC